MRKVILLLFIVLIGWIVTDLYYPFKTDISKINADATARLDAAMWRSYYENKKVKLFFQSATLMRNQFHFPLIRSHIVAIDVAKAAFVFKEGKSRADYNKALPPLCKYFTAINDISTIKFNIDSAAKTELEWWIIRRDKTISPAEWERWLAATASVMYHKPADSFKEYARLRVKAMLLRDEKDTTITESDWNAIEATLIDAWRSFAITCK